MALSSSLKRRLFSLLLGLALLQLGWLQLSHDLEYHLHPGDKACEFCVFAGHLGNGVASHLPSPLPAMLTDSFVLPVYQSPSLPADFRYSINLRGPPTLSQS